MAIVDPDAVRRQAASGQLAPVYLLLGDDDRTISGLIEGMAAGIDEDLRAFNYERLYATDKGITPAAVVEAARVVPMLAPARLVVVLRAEKWLKPKRVATEEDVVEGAEEAEGAEAQRRGGAEPAGSIGPLVEYLKAPVASTVLAIVASDVNGSLPAVKALKKYATVVECWGLVDRDERGPGAGLREGIAWVRQASETAGRQIEPAAARMLAERAAGDMAKLRTTLEHALLFAQDRPFVTREHVEAVSSESTAGQDPWALVNAIQRGQAAEALRLLGAALENGAVPYMVLGQLGWFAREKLPAIRPASHVQTAVQALFRTDLDLKSSGGDPRVLLERLVLELCGRPARRR